ncbi:MAG: DUF1292 domain-containing protein [Clostridiales bacterium]|nr:DUF1292 domain-containing protein [Clostridiales bacterium]
MENTCCHDFHDCGDNCQHDCDCNREERDDIITLYDDNGEENDYIIVDGVEYNNKMYIALIEAEQIDNEECEFIVLRADTDDNGEDYFNTIDNEKEFNEVLNLLQKKLNENDGDFEIEIE